MLKTFIFLISAIVTRSTLADYESDYKTLILQIDSDPQLRKDFDQNIKYAISLDQNYLNYTPTVKFNCPIPNSPDLKQSGNVHELRPSDIKVVAALGDSITAGIGIKAYTPLGLLVEFRGSSWSIGGAKDLQKDVTLPNILKQYNPKIVGYSTKDNLFLIKHQKLNMAGSGNKAKQILGQARQLIRLIKADKGIDFNNDWKLVTLFVGGNDLCQYCLNAGEHEPENYINSIQKALDLLHAELPRTLVNFVSMVNVEDIRDMNTGLVCNLLHRFECPCAAFPKSNADILVLESYVRNYTQLSKNLVESGRYDTKEDFTVVLQKFYTEFKAPRLDNGKVDLSYFAPDCFHYSAKSHAMSAVALWNNMLQPVGKKATTIDIGEDILCPTEEHPYFYTNKNSN